jgi:hypothetical protein
MFYRLLLLANLVHFTNFEPYFSLQLTSTTIYYFKISPKFSVINLIFMTPKCGRLSDIKNAYVPV